MTRVRDQVPEAVPVTVKVRVGWDSSEGLEDIAAAAAAGGAAWLTVHARTRAQLYAPPVRWPDLARARAAVSIPVVANGDLRVPEDLSLCAAQSGCHAFMIGRAAMARPDLFAAIRGTRDFAQFALAELAAIVRDYHAAMLADGLQPGRAVARVKQWLRLAAQLDPRTGPHFAAIKAEPAWPPIAAHLATMR